MDYRHCCHPSGSGACHLRVDLSLPGGVRASPGFSMGDSLASENRPACEGGDYDNGIEEAWNNPPFVDIEIDVRRQPDRPRMSFEKSWPDDVWSVGIDRFDFLGVDNDGALYWDGKKVEVRHPLSLTMWQRIASEYSRSKASSRSAGTSGRTRSICVIRLWASARKSAVIVRRFMPLPFPASHSPPSSCTSVGFRAAV